MFESSLCSKRFLVVSVQTTTLEQKCFGHAKNGPRDKKLKMLGGGGRGSGRKETFAGKPWDFENPACQ